MDVLAAQGDPEKILVMVKVYEEARDQDHIQGAGDKRIHARDV